jgi:hypothetical protein
LDEHGQAHKKTEKQQCEAGGFDQLRVLAEHRWEEAHDLVCYKVGDNESED